MESAGPWREVKKWLIVEDVAISREHGASRVGIKRKAEELLTDRFKVTAQVRGSPHVKV